LEGVDKRDSVTVNQPDVSRVIMVPDGSRHDRSIAGSVEGGHDPERIGDWPQGAHGVCFLRVEGDRLQRLGQGLSFAEGGDAPLDDPSVLMSAQLTQALSGSSQILNHAGAPDDELVLHRRLDQLGLTDVLLLGDLADQFAKPLISESEGECALGHDDECVPFK
jgi:hypothetical protein